MIGALIVVGFVVWLLASVGVGYVVALDESTDRARERATSRHPRLHRMVTCYPCAIGWSATAIGCYGAGVVVSVVHFGPWCLCAAIPVLAAAGLGTGVVLAMLGGVDAPTK